MQPLHCKVKELHCLINQQIFMESLLHFRPRTKDWEKRCGTGCQQFLLSPILQGGSPRTKSWENNSTDNYCLICFGLSPFSLPPHFVVSSQLSLFINQDTESPWRSGHSEEGMGIVEPSISGHIPLYTTRSYFFVSPWTFGTLQTSTLWIKNNHAEKEAFWPLKPSPKGAPSTYFYRRYM